MDWPKTLSEVGVWSLMQFPVVAVTLTVSRLVYREARRQATERVADARQAHLEVLAEKERRIADRDERIRELKAEVAELKAKLGRSKKKEGEK